jgi:hypothetical protein
MEATQHLSIDKLTAISNKQDKTQDKTNTRQGCDLAIKFMLS